jgi:hypothetical protein
MKNVEGRCCVLIICDGCGQPITDAWRNAYLSRVGVKESDFGNRVYFVHYTCYITFRKDHPQDGFRWVYLPLQALPIYVGESLGLNWEEARRMVESLNRGE